MSCFFAFPKSIGPMIRVMWWKSRWSEFIMIMNLTGCCLDRFKVLECEFKIMKILVDMVIMSPDILFPWQSITHRVFVLSIVSICNIIPHNNCFIEIVLGRCVIMTTNTITCTLFLSDFFLLRRTTWTLFIHDIRDWSTIMSEIAQQVPFGW